MRCLQPRQGRSTTGNGCNKITANDCHRNQLHMCILHAQLFWTQPLPILFDHDNKISCQLCVLHVACSLTQLQSFRMFLTRRTLAKQRSSQFLQFDSNAPLNVWPLIYGHICQQRAQLACGLAACIATHCIWILCMIMMQHQHAKMKRKSLALSGVMRVRQIRQKYAFISEVCLHWQLPICTPEGGCNHQAVH